MNTIETIGVSVFMAIFTGLIGLLLGGRKKVTVDEFEKHRTSDNPHTQCPVHTTQLSEIKKILDRIDSRVYKLIGGIGNGGNE